MSVILALLLLLPLPALQDDPDAAYREDYADYTEIAAMRDPAAQATAYLDFLEEGFDDRLLSAVIPGVQQALVGVTQAGNYDAVYPLADRLAALHPDSVTAARALGLEAAAMAGNSEQIVKYGEPFYQTNPSPQIALLLTRAFGQLGNEPKMLEYGQIALDSGEFPIADIWSIAYALLQNHDRNGRTTQAVDVARQLRSGVRTAPEGVSAGDWNGIQVYLLDLIARNDYEAKRYREALTSYDAVLTIQPCNQKALYFKGNAMLQTGSSVNEATRALAKAAVLDGSYATPARELLESTYARNAPGGAAGRFVNDALNEARREPGCNRP